MAVSITTIYDEIKDHLNMGTTTDSNYVSAVSSADTYLTEEFINRMSYEFIMGSEASYPAELRGSNFDFGTATPPQFQVYVASKPKWEFWLSPSFTVESDVEYELTASGTLSVLIGSPTTTEDTRSTITISAVPVNFALLMAECFQVIADHYARQPQQSTGAVSVSPVTMRVELMRQKSHWINESYLYM